MSSRLPRSGLLGPVTAHASVSVPELLTRALERRAAGHIKPSLAVLRLALDIEPSAHHLDAAHLASQWAQHELAADLFARADRYAPLGDEHRLEMALATLAAAERLRLPHGRQGAWARHKVLLVRAEALLEHFSRSEARERLRAVALTALARALRLQRADSRRIEATLAQAATLHLRLAEQLSGA